MTEQENNRDTKGRVPFVQMVPNMVTLTGMCLGLTSIRFAVDERFMLATFLIMLAAVMDGLDGLMARRLNSTSELGGELDSLSDFVCFGVAPSILIYQFFLSSLGGLGWIFALVYAGAACLRLARFNVMKDKPKTDDSETPHFVGVPSPGGAMLALMPAFLVFGGYFDAHLIPMIVAIWLGFVGVLMISTMRTLSLKAVRIPRSLSRVVLVLTLLVVGLVFFRPWLLLVSVNVIYIFILLVSIVKARGNLFAQA